jgi:cytochrome c-type biogenesis protein CcmH/NrfG
MIRCLAMIAKPRALALIALASGCVTDAGATKAFEPPCVQPSAAVNDSIAHAEAGRQAMARRDYANAIRELQKAVQIEPRNHAAWYALGGSYDATNRPGEAWQAYAHATVLDDDQPLYWLRLGLALYEDALTQDADATKAKAALERAIGLEPQLYRAHHTLGSIAAEAQDARAAAEAFSRAITIVPREADSYVELGELYLDWEFTAQAIQVLQQAEAHVVAPARARVRLVLGRAYRETGDPKAIDTLTAALEDDPALDGVLFERGMAYAAANDHAKAKQDLEAFQKVAPQYAREWRVAHDTVKAMP